MDVKVTRELIGEEEDDADLIDLLVEDGASVQEGDPIAQLETSKVTVEAVAPASGTITFRAEVGDVVSIGDVIATIS